MSETKPLRLAGSLRWAIEVMEHRRPRIPDGSTLYDSETDTHYVRENGEWIARPECTGGYSQPKGRRGPLTTRKPGDAHGLVQ